VPKKKENINKEQGMRLSKIRKSRNITQERLAELTNYSVQTISGIETGSRRMTLESASIFAKHLGVRLEYLMCQDDYPTVLDLYHKEIDTEKGNDNSLDNIIKLLSYQIKYAKSETTYSALCETYSKISATDKNIPFIFHPDNPDTFNDLVIMTDSNLRECIISLDKFVAFKKEIIEFIEFKLQKLMKEGEAIETS
jgi:transcriptional regulator with XRE-family HTH domain